MVALGFYFLVLQWDYLQLLLYILRFAMFLFQVILLFDLQEVIPCFTEIFFSWNYLWVWEISIFLDISSLLHFTFSPDYVLSLKKSEIKCIF